VGHIVHSGACGAQNIDTLFFMLGWDRYGFNKKHAATCYAKLMFFHPVGSAAHVVHTGASRAQNVDALFFMLGWTGTDSTKCAPGHIAPKSIFASSGICGSRSAFRCVRGTNHRCTTFYARVGPVQIQQKARGDIMMNLCFYIRLDLWIT
jgi:hypothetical protein